MQKNPNSRAQLRSAAAAAMSTAPLIELNGNRRIVLEGSTGVLLYEDNNIKINTEKMVVSFCGRGLNVRCITCSCVEVTGFITKIEFIT